MSSCYFCAALYANCGNLTSTVFTQFKFMLEIKNIMGYKNIMARTRSEVTGTHVIHFKLAQEIKATVVGSRIRSRFEDFIF